VIYPVQRIEDNIMKRILLIGTLLLLATFAFADQGTYRDKDGNTSGSWSDNGDLRTYRDSLGNSIGSSVTDGDMRDYRDRDGNSMGSRDRDRNRDDD
jgi:hypothetical protein